MNVLSFEWAHIAITILASAISGITGLIAGTWKVARVEGDIRRDFSEEIAKAIQNREERLTELAEQFDETLKALRQKINDVELSTYKGFVGRKEFEDFRME